MSLVRGTDTAMVFTILEDEVIWGHIGILVVPISPFPYFQLPNTSPNDDES